MKTVFAAFLATLFGAFVSIAAPTRVANTSLNLPTDLPSGSYSTTNAFPGLSFTDPVAIVTPPGETNRLFIVEKIGRIAVIPDLGSPSKEIFLDISTATRTGGEEGLLGLAFHPNYNNVGATGYGEFFIYYQTNVSNQAHWRLSRFSVNPSDPDRANPNSEVPMITQRDRNTNHNGGDLHFGPDGYLYISVGDEGGANDTRDRGQHIDGDFFAAIFRIDVDQRPENLVPNSHPAIHANTYRVPADNPFVGATSFNGSTVNSANVRTEIWAIGMRNPWRMSFDRPTGRLFVADVGQGAREEINILDEATFDTNSGIPNYGWSFREGFQPFTNGPGGATPPTGFSHIDPIHDYPRSLGQSVTGGLVYRGSQYPELTGDYLFADYVSGRIWAMDDPGETSQSVTEIASDNNIAGFGLDPSTGDILMGDLGSDAIKRLVRTTGSGTQPPQFLSQTGAFSNLSNLTPEAGILPYSINLPFWSDLADKTRWFSIPDLADDMAWVQDGNWSFPEGQVWIKHFELELNRDSPGTDRRRIETRFLVKTADDVYGITYRWNAAQTDAELVTEGGTTADFTVTEAGQTRSQTWVFPSRNDCRTCHTQVGGAALSFNTRQLNAIHDYGSGPENQLDALESAGYFSNSIPEPATLPTYSAPDDEGATLEDRARSFLAVNCISCHQPGGSALGSWDARPWLTLEQSGIVGSLVSNNGGDSHARTLVPGDPDSSMLLQRLLAARHDSGGNLPAMPPLGSTEPNEEGIALLEAWINETPRVLFVRGADRSGGFLEAGNDTSRTEHLADIGNYQTFGGNHGWGELADALTNAGFEVSQIAETAENGSGQSQGIHLDFETMNLDQYDVLVFGSNNAVYDVAAIDAIDDYIRGGGGALFISDANFGGNWADASNSDQQFLDRFGLIMNQDAGTYSLFRSQGDFLVPDHPILENVNQFDGEGVTPISIGSLPGDVTATILARAKNTVRRNPQPAGSAQGPTQSPGANDAALIVANAGEGRIAGHFDRNTFFNRNGAGTNINRFDNESFAINLFTWLADPALPDPLPSGLTATDGIHPDRVELMWDFLPGAIGYTVYRNNVDDFAGADAIATTTTTSHTDTTGAYGTTYHYWITATVDSIETGPSSSARGSRFLAPPTGLGATDGAFTDRVVLTWTTVPAASGYQVYRGTTNVFGSASAIDSPTAPPYEDTSVVPGTSYFYWIVAIGGGEESAASGPDSGYAGLAAPTGLSATDGTSTENISLSWNAVSGATGYRVYRSTQNNPATSSALADTVSTTYIDSSALLPARTYHYWVAALSGGLTGARSSSDAGYLAFVQVSGLTASQGTNSDGIELSWDPVGNAALYRIYRGSSSDFGSASLIGSSNSTEFFDSTAEPLVDYFYFVRAGNVYGNGPESTASPGLRSLEVVQPDLLVGRTLRLIGNDRYVSLAGQSVRISSSQRRAISAWWRIQNDGTRDERFRLVGTRTNRLFRLVYRSVSPARNISGRIFIGDHITGDLAAGDSELARIQISPQRSLRRSLRTGRIACTIRAFANSDTSKRDSVRINASSRR